MSLRARWSHLLAAVMPAAPRPAGFSSRMYHGAAGGRLTASWAAPNSSADTEIVGSLQRLRGRSRQLDRDAAYAKRAKVVVTNNVIGAGMGLQALVMNQRGALIEKVNSEIEAAHRKWGRARSCHTGGVLGFPDMERAGIGQVFETGEAFIRLHYRKFGDSAVPFALELIEAERIAEEYVAPMDYNGNELRMGVEVDPFYRPIAYWVRERHPGDLRSSAYQTDRLVRVPAEQMIHAYICERWPQTRGIPWLHATARRLNDMEGYSEAEIVAARGAASYMGFIKTPTADVLPPDGVNDGKREINFEPGIMEHLPPGAEIIINNPNRPNPGMDPFMRLMLREVAAGCGVSYESLSRDYSQSNYSSSRLALLDDRDLWKVIQQWWIRTVREPLYRIWLEQAVLARAIPSIGVAEYVANVDKFESAAFKPRGWSWVDPTKEVAAYKEAVKAGFTTVSDVIAATGNGDDFEDMLIKRRRELDLAKEQDLEFDTDPGADQKPAPPAPAPKHKDDDEGEDDVPPDADDDEAAQDKGIRRVA